MPENTDQITETQQLLLDLAGAQHRIGELEHKLSEVERQRDEAASMADSARERLADLRRAPELALLANAFVSTAGLLRPVSGRGDDSARYLGAAEKILGPIADLILRG